MKNEFNLRSTGLVDMAWAWTLAVPAVYLTVQQYGVTGLAVAATLLTVSQASRWIEKSFEKHAASDPALAEEFPDIDTADEIRLQRICDELTPRFGLGHIPTTMLKPSKLAAFCMPKQVYVTSNLVKKLDDQELAFVVAHELDHIRNKDTRINTLHMSASMLNTLALVATGADMLLFKQGLNNYSSIWAVLGAHFWISMSVAMAKSAVSRANEYRSDFNAATVTRDPRAGMTGLKDTVELIMESKDLPKIRGHISQMLMSHPQIQHRMRRLQKMGHKGVAKKSSPLAASLV